MKNLFNKKHLNIPNSISLLRLLIIPYLGYLSLANQARIFGIVLIFYALSDFLDGYFARKLNQTSEFGAKLDSLADDLGNNLMIIFLYFLFPDIFNEYTYFVYLIVFLNIISNLLKIFKLRNIGLHFYSSKISQTSFLSTVVFLSLFGFNATLFYIWFFISVFHFSEIIISVLLFKPNSNTRSIVELINKQ